MPKTWDHVGFPEHTWKATKQYFFATGTCEQYVLLSSGLKIAGSGEYIDISMVALEN